MVELRIEFLTELFKQIDLKLGFQIQNCHIHTYFLYDLYLFVFHLAESTQIVMTVITRQLAKDLYESTLLDICKQFPGLTHKLIIPGFKKDLGSTCISQFVIGTPDMLEKEIFKRNYIDLSNLKVFVLDEAQEIINIGGLTPTKKQMFKIKDAIPESCEIKIFNL